MLEEIKIRQDNLTRLINPHSTSGSIADNDPFSVSYSFG